MCFESRLFCFWNMKVNKFFEINMRLLWIIFIIYANLYGNRFSIENSVAPNYNNKNGPQYIFTCTSMCECIINFFFCIIFIARLKYIQVQLWWPAIIPYILCTIFLQEHTYTQYVIVGIIPKYYEHKCIQFIYFYAAYTYYTQFICRKKTTKSAQCALGVRCSYIHASILYTCIVYTIPIYVC